MDQHDKLSPEQRFELAKIEIEHSFARQVSDRQHHFESRKEYARQVLEYSLQYERHLKDYGQMALRSLFLLNGGAMVALLAFLGSSVGKSVGATQISPSQFVWPFSYFAGALVAVTLSMTFAYFNYVGHHGVRADPGALANNMIAMQDKWPGNFTDGYIRLTNWSFRCAFFFGVVALGLFITGCILVAKVFASFPPA